MDFENVYGLKSGSHVGFESTNTTFSYNFCVWNSRKTYFGVLESPCKFSSNNSVDAQSSAQSNCFSTIYPKVMWGSCFWLRMWGFDWHMDSKKTVLAIKIRLQPGHPKGLTSDTWVDTFTFKFQMGFTSLRKGVEGWWGVSPRSATGLAAKDIETWEWWMTFRIPFVGRKRIIAYECTYR